VVKGTQGIGVILAETEQAALTVLETFWNLGMNILVQEFIEESEGRDIRALVVGDRVVTAMRRQATVGEFRSNVHRGGTGTVVDLPESYRRAALEATRVMDLQLAGVDMLESEAGPKVVEINSSPGFEGLERWTGVDIASVIIEYVVAFARARGRKRKAAGRMALRIAGRGIRRGTVEQILLKVSEYYTATPVNVAVTVIRGAERGPAVFLTAAIHGDELNGVEIVRQVMTGYTPQQLRAR